MDYRNLGRTGVKVSPLCLGCMMFGSGADEAVSGQIIDAGLDAGINFFDTADAYGRGVSEEIVGRALAGKRDRVVLATKVHAQMDKTDPNSSRIHRRHVIEGCEASLRRLKTDWIDLYQLHRSHADIAIDETLRALDDLIRAGKVRYAGTSTFMSWEIVEALWASKELGLNRFVCEQPPYSLMDRRAERELIPMAQTFGLGLIPWSPLAGGLLTGKYKRGAIPPDARYAKAKEGSPHFSDAAFQIMEGLEQLASQKQCSPAQLALAWCAAQPGITSPIIGPKTMDQLQDNLGALEVKLTDEDLRRLDEIAPPGGVTVPYYESANWAAHFYRI